MNASEAIAERSDAQMRVSEAYEGLAQKTETLDRDALNAGVPGHDYSVRVMLMGVVEHGAYHGHDHAH